MTEGLIVRRRKTGRPPRITSERAIEILAACGIHSRRYYSALTDDQITGLATCIEHADYDPPEFHPNPNVLWHFYEHLCMRALRSGRPEWIKRDTSKVDKSET